MDDFIRGTTGFVNPLIKWAGGKRRLLEILMPKYITPSFSETATFYEPFAGSGVVSLNCGFNKIVMGDKNTRLMIFYEEVRDRPVKLHSKIITYKKQFEMRHELKAKEIYYYRLRDEFNSIGITKIETAKNSGIKLSALFWILNKTDFNGMYRETKNGEFNIPFGQRELPPLNYEDIDAVSIILNRSSLRQGDFAEICRDVQKGDVVYLDPPYLPISKTASFSTYLGKGFDIKEHQRLKKMMTNLSEKGANVILSNSDCDLTRKIYKGMPGFKIDVVDVRRLISGNKKGRKIVKEIIMSNVR